MPCHRSQLGRGMFLPLMIAALLAASAVPVRSQALTHLRQLTEALHLQHRTNANVRLEVTVCAASRPELGVLIVQDSSGFELLEMGELEWQVQPGEKIRIHGDYCLLRKRGMGIEISASPSVDNDGMHVRRTWGGSAILRAGLNPLRVEWFNHLRELHLEVLHSFSNAPFRGMETSNLWHAVVDDSGATNVLPGLIAEAYEGDWEAMPNFDLLQPARVGVVTNFDLGFRTDEELVGIRFKGFFKVPQDGLYQLRTRSDDGSLVFLGRPGVPIIRLGAGNVPPPAKGYYGIAMDDLQERRWVTAEGRVGFISRKGRGFEYELHSDQNVILVQVADAGGWDPAQLRNKTARVTGIGRGVLTVSQRVVLGRLIVASAREMKLEEGDSSQPSTNDVIAIERVQSLPLEEARRALPVKVRGVVTGARNSFFDRRMSIQDETRGIFVNLNSITNLQVAFTDFVEVEGRTGAGDFAPIIIADRVTLLGAGGLHEPARPTWTELLNGSKDVQWAELQGLVTEVHSNRVSLLLPEGRLEVLLEGYLESQLTAFKKTILSIRGVLYALWDAETREVRVGSVLMRNASISVDVPAPIDVFDAVVKTPRTMRLFDSQATAFRRVKVRGQIVYADASQMFLEDEGAGLRLLASAKTDLRAGDLVEAVGYPDIGRSTLLLREAILRKTGEAALPVAKKIKESELARNNLDSTRVDIEGKLLGWHLEQGSPVLEMQSGKHLYLARLAPGTSREVSLRNGSQLALVGVYVERGRDQHPNPTAESFDLMLNSPADIIVLSQPSWWTLPRLLIFMGFLLVILAIAAIWISQLRRLVEQRTAQLRGEIQERGRVERQHALEAERSRIARDLHDDLGSSLTEISVLASTGQRPNSDELKQVNLFQTIAAKARTLIASLDVIVWAVDPEDNSLQSLADYVTGHAEDFFSHMNIACRFKVPIAFPPATVDGRVRHDLLMAVKEALNNIVRHAEATEVEFRMWAEENALMIEIADNGKGFEGGKGGHGLKNLPARLLNLGGTCVVESRVGLGTTVSIRLPLPVSPVETSAGAG